MAKKDFVIDVSKMDNLNDLSVEDILNPTVLVLRDNLVGLFSKVTKYKDHYDVSLEDTTSKHADELFNALITRMVDPEKKTIFFGKEKQLTYWRDLFVKTFGICSDSIVPMENAKERKNVKVWWVKGYENIRLAVKTDDNVNIKEVVADNIRFMYPVTRPKKLKGDDIQVFYNNEAKSILKVVKYAWGKSMKIDKIISNPPFDIGSYIVRAIIDYCMDEDTEAMVIGPLNMYKSKNNYKHVAERYPLENLFDANITKNLSLVRLSKTTNENKTYKELEMESYDPKFRAFYEVNVSLPKRYSMKNKQNSVVSDWDFDLEFVESTRLPCHTGGSGYRIGNNVGYRINVLKQIPIEMVAMTCSIPFDTKVSKDNFSIWAYSSNKKDNLANLLIMGINGSGAGNICNPAIPQIDWANIHVNQKELWEAKDYDKAVLAEMSRISGVTLVWNEAHDGVVKK